MRKIIIVLGWMVGACGGGGGGGGDDTNFGTDARINPPSGAKGPYFETPMFFNDVVTGLAPAATSAQQIAALRAEGGWGNGNVMQIDFSIEVLNATPSTPKRSFTATSDFYTPDCDQVEMPVPPGGNVEGETGYSCDGDGDCHLIVFDQGGGRLYEMWRANITTAFYGGCLAAWDTRAQYVAGLRGEQCSSADAAGFPIAPLLFTADEVAAGHIDHAIRFILPNNRPKRGYVHPASHGTNTTGTANAPAYGAHFRLRADYPIDTLPNEGAKVVARAMQKYGMYHADGGNIALTAQSDKYTTAKWDNLLGPRDLDGLKVEDFEVIDHGSMLTLTFDCTR